MRPADVRMIQGVTSNPDVEFPDQPYAADSMDTDVPDAIPVVVVDTYTAGNLVDWSANRQTVTGENTVRIAGASRNRKRLLITNNGPNTVYLVSGEVSASGFGYPLRSTDPPLEMLHNEAVFATCVTAESALVGVIQEYDIDDE